MELIYCLIKKYKSLKDCEINFGGKYRFAYDEQNNILSGKIDPDYIQQLFPGNIINVSAIIGKNGTGKSSVIEFLLENLPSGNANTNPDSIIVHYDVGFEQYIIFRGPSYADTTIEFDVQINYEPVSALRNSHDYGTFVYYTNGMYDRIGDYNTGGLLNVSLKSLLFNQDSAQYFITDQNFKPEEIYTNFRLKEYWRILRILQSGIKLDIGFRLPEFLVLYINRNKQNYLLQKYANTNTEDKSISFYRQLFDIEKYYSQKNTNLNDHVATFLNNLEKNMVFDRIAHLQARSTFPALSDVLLSSPAPDTLLKYLFQNDELLSVNNFLDATRKLLTDYSTKQSDFLASISIDNINPEFFKDYIEKMKKLTLWDSDFVSIGFSFEPDRLQEISSGQMAFLTLFARIYALSEGEQRFGNLTVNGFATVIVDEGELYLHPEWQKKIVQLLTNCLPQIFNRSVVQIILTSHSPFIVSDLPKSKLTFMIDYGERKNSNSDLLQHGQTFAANIHSLLADSFFMQDGFMGEFAKAVIDKVITDLSSTKEISRQRRDDMKKIIVGIGEPIIRRKLLELYTNKFNLGLEERVSIIEKKLGL